jgi:hypothetical protein
MKAITKTALVFMLCWMFSFQVFAKTAVVVAKDSPLTVLNIEAVSNIFLARTSRYENGQKAIPIEVESREARANFYQQISGKTAAQLNSYWTTLVFTGKGKPPKTYSSQADVLNKLTSQPGTITYMPLSAITKELKVLYVFD